MRTITITLLAVLLVAAGGSREEAWRKAIMDPDPEVRLAAAREIGEAEDVPQAMIGILRIATLDGDERVRMAAGTALARQGAVTAPAYEQMLTDPLRRADAAKALSKAGPRGVPLALKLARSAVWYVREAALGALAYMGPHTDATLESVSVAADDESAAVRLALAEVLVLQKKASKIALRIAGELLRDEHRSVRSRALSAVYRLEGMDDIRIDLCAIALGDAEEHGRWSAVCIVHEIKSCDEKRVGVLAKALADKSPKVRLSAARALHAVAGAAKALGEALGHEDAEVRRVAARSLRSRGKGAAGTEAALEKALADPEVPVRGEAALALVRLGRREGGVAKALADSIPLWGAWSWKEEPMNRRPLSGHRNLRAFGGRGGKSGQAPPVPPVAKLTADEAAAGLVSIGEASVAPLKTALGAKEPAARANAAWTLAKLGEKAIDPLLPLLEDPDFEVRITVGVALARCGGPKAKVARGLARAVVGARRYERWIAWNEVVVKALAGIGVEAVPGIVDAILEGFEGYFDAANVDTLLDALRRMGDKAVEALEGMAKTDERKEGIRLILSELRR